MILMLGPRLTDPRAKVDYFLELFRFSEEKEKVQIVLKARTTVLASSLFRQSGLNLQPIGGYGVAAENATVAKPFMGLKGMAAARERVVKPVGKPIALLNKQPLPLSRSEGDVQKLNEGINGLSLKNRQINTSAPNLASIGVTTQVTATTVTLALESMTTKHKNGDSDEFADRILNENKERQLPTSTFKTSTSSATLPTSVNTVGAVVNNSVAILDSVSASEVKVQPKNTTPLKILCPTEAVSSPGFGSAGMVQRILKGHIPNGNKATSDFSPKFIEGKVKSFEVRVIESVDSSSLEAKSTSKNMDINNGNGFGSSSSSSSTAKPFIHPGPLLLPESFQRRSSSSAISLSSYRMESCTKDTSNVNVKGMIGRSKKGNERGEKTDTSSHNDLDKLIEEELEVRSNGARPLSASMKRGLGIVTSQDQNQNYIETFKKRSTSFTNGCISNSSLGICTPRGTPVKIAWIRDKSFYEEMTPEGPVGMDGDGNPLFRIDELRRLNFMKEYDGVNQSELEQYMIEEDFLEHFGMTKVFNHSLFILKINHLLRFFFIQKKISSFLKI
jgi:hypothetical protein